jgi:hypothetical protein
MTHREHVENTMLTGPNDRSRREWSSRVALCLAGLAILSSALHFWPLEDSKWWQILCVQNAALLAWALVISAGVVVARDAGIFSRSLPHVSVLAYVAVNVLSVAFARDFGRSAQFVAKLGLVLIVGYSLFHSAVNSTRSLRVLLGATCLAVVVAIGAAMVSRLLPDLDRYGFFDSPYKYGTYVATLAPLCSVYLITGSRWIGRATGVALLLAAVVSSGTLGALVGLSTGAIVAACYAPSWPMRLSALTGPALAVAVVIGAGAIPALSRLHDDLRWREHDTTNLRQRYIEWQAEINLLEQRAIAGAGAGSINDYRSAFYLRLPKLNTLQPFDLNGWLSVGAETGIVGLMCFCWIVVHHFRLAHARVRSASAEGRPDMLRLAAAGMAGLAAACAANLFSALQYNGVLIVLALVLALIAGLERSCRE